MSYEKVAEHRGYNIYRENGTYWWKQLPFKTAYGTVDQAKQAIDSYCDFYGVDGSNIPVGPYQN